MPPPALFISKPAAKNFTRLVFSQIYRNINMALSEYARREFEHILKIVIVGAGEVGYSVAKNLSSDGHDIVIIEDNSEPIMRKVPSTLWSCAGTACVRAFWQKPA